MLQKVYYKEKDETRTTLLYVETKNFEFNPERVYDLNYDKITIPERLLGIIKDLVIHQLHFPSYDGELITDKYTVKLGDMVRTPNFLLEEENR